mgnify:CR=1 FL=1|jgi:hypothetical protein
MEKNEKKITTTAEFINEVQNVLNSEKPQEVKKTKKNEKVLKEVKAQKKEDKTSKKKTKKNEKVLKEVKAQNEINLVEEVISKREVKYKYPEDCIDTLSRKKYRQQVRNKLHQLELEMYRIQDKQSKEFKRKSKEYESYKKEILKEGAAA